jgi:hypothetical protein
MKLYLAEKEEAANVDWLRFAGLPEIQALDDAQKKTLQDYHKSIYHSAFTAGVKKAFEIAEPCEKCGHKPETNDA